MDVYRLKPASTRLVSAFLIAFTLFGLSCSLSAFAQFSAEAIYSYNAGIQLYNQGKSGEAIRKFQDATAIDPQYASAYYNMGSIYYQMAQYDKATAMFNKALSLTPNDQQARYNLALCLEKKKQYTDALTVLGQIPPTDSLSAKVRQKTAEIQRQKDASAAASKVVTKPAGRTVFSKGYDGPTGIVIGSGGFMYVANYLDNVIYRVGASGDKTVFAKESQGINGPIGLSYNPKANELYVANYLANNIVKISSTGKVSVLISGLTKPYNLFFDEINNTLYASEQESNIISKIVLQ